MKESSEDFQNYFSQVYGTEKWPSLYQSLQNTETKICYSGFSQNSLAQYLQSPNEFIFSQQEQATFRSEAGHLENYILDPASLAPVAALGLEPHDQVLDLCAAPGGKSLAIISQLGAEGFLLSNDPSPSRAQRLKKVLRQYTPENLQPSYSVSQKDGTKFGFYHSYYHPEKFNKILVDAPCSSERHHIHQNTLSEWKIKKSKVLAMKQYTLLCAALLCAKPHATIVYSTCSINPVENDDVISKLLKKKKDYIEFDTAPSFANLGSTPTQWGQIILPDAQGFGPIYYCKLKVKDQVPTSKK